MSIIRDAFDRALDRLKKKSGIRITHDDNVIITTKRVPRFPKEEKSNVVYFNPDVHTGNKDRCSDCDLKKKDDIEKKKKEAIKKVAEELKAIPQEEFMAELDKHYQCDPKTCWGECDGKGWCYIAQEWQQRIHPNTFTHYTFKKGKKKKRKKKKRK